MRNLRRELEKRIPEIADEAHRSSAYLVTGSVPVNEVGFCGFDGSYSDSYAAVEERGEALHCAGG